ncbi:DNA-directed RNA polymerase I subunit RPA49 [Hetaerina americana]|uniref:DNA-directed RNA polymerase I subunit RPA49 n=1 Tax=Hetaerina americana TaxID=62018 RepID=UPI003A7F1970
MGKLSRKGVVSEIILAKDRLPPIIVDFQNGNVDPNEIGCLNVNVHKCERTNKRLVSVTSDGIGYKGVCKNPLLRRFIAIRRKSTREVRLFEAAMCTLSPCLEQTKAVKLNLSDNEIRRALAKAYGTKARRMNAVLAETLKLDADEVKEAAANVEITEERLEEASKMKVDPVYEVLPPHQREAKEIEEVYKLEDILVEEILHHFDEEVKRIMNCTPEELKENNLSEFFFSAWQVLQCKYDGMERKILSLKCLLFVECLGHLLQTSAVNLRKVGYSTCYFSETLSDYILNLFTSKMVNGRSCSKAQQDKAICYVLVLCFLNFDYKVDITTLIKVTKSSVTRLTQLCRVIGARVDKQRIATLRLPLAVPPVPRKQKKT